MELSSIILNLLFLGVNIFFYVIYCKIAKIQKEKTDDLKRGIENYNKNVKTLIEKEKFIGTLDKEMSEKTIEFLNVKRLNDEVYNRQLYDLYMGMMDIKKATEMHMSLLDPIMEKDALEASKHNLKIINQYIKTLKSQTNKKIETLGYKYFQAEKYDFSKN